jgi:alkaline phosphatase
MPRFSRARWIMGGACVAALSLAGAAMVTAHNGPDKVQALAHQINDRKPRNVIMFLGDGMGDSEITAARCSYAGAGGHLRMDAFPFTGEQTTWSVKPGPGPTYLPDYVPDSAATGTAWRHWSAGGARERRHRRDRHQRDPHLVPRDPLTAHAASVS